MATCLLSLGGAGLALVEACNASTASAVDAGPEARPACLTNLQQENGTACEAPDGYSCPVEIPCSGSPLYQQADCVCSSGKWACSYAATALDAAVIPPGATPMCVSNGHGDQAACPASEVEALQGGAEGGALPCAPANTGLQCLYDSGVTCPGAAFPNLDTCACVGGPDGGLVFACESVFCDVVPPDAALDQGLEAAAPDAGRD